MRYFLDSTHRRIVRAEVMEANTPHLGSPTHGVVVGGDFYFIGNSGWDIEKGKPMTPAVLLRAPIE